MHNERESLIFNFDYANDCFDFFLYAIKARENIKIYENSLEFSAVVDPTVLFDSHKYIYTKSELLAKLLFEKIEDFLFNDDNAEAKELDLLALVRFIDEMMLSVYAMPERPEIAKIEEVVKHIIQKYMALIAEKFKDSEKNKVALIKIILNYSLEMEQVLKKYGLRDSTINRLCVVLMNINKKSFFNSSVEVLNRILNRLDQPGALKGIFVDFYRTLNSFFEVFELFSNFEGFESVLTEFFRRTHIFFLFNLEKIITNPNIKLTLDDMASFMGDCFKGVEQNDKFITVLAQSHPSLEEPWGEELLSFRIKFIKLGMVVLHRFNKEVKQMVEAAFKETNLENLDLENRVNKLLSPVIRILSNVHVYYLDRIRRPLVHVLMSEFLRAVLSSTDEQLGEYLENSKTEMSIVLELFKDLYGIQSQKKFLEILVNFFKTRTRSMVEIYISQLATLSGVYLHDHTTTALLESRSYSGLNFKSKDLLNYWRPLMVKEQQIKKLKDGINVQKSNAQKYVSILFNVLIFIKKLKFRYLLRKSKPLENEIQIMRMSTQEVRPVKELSVDDYFNRLSKLEVGFFCFKRKESLLKRYGVYDKDKDAESILRTVNQQIYNQVHILFHGNKVYLRTVQRNHNLKIIIPKKIFSFQLIDSQKKYGLLIEYDQGLNIIFRTKKASHSSLLFQSFNKLMNRASKVTLVPEDQPLFDVASLDPRDNSTSFLEKLYLTTRYEFVYPEIRKEIKIISVVKEKKKWEIPDILGFGFKKKRFLLEVGAEMDAKAVEPYSYNFLEDFKVYGFTDPEEEGYQQARARVGYLYFLGFRQILLLVYVEGV